MKNLIIARYKENLDWLQNVNNDFNVYIYDKSPAKLRMSNDAATNYNVVYLQNSKGNEAHTYFKFIIDNYNEIKNDDIYIFTQGNPLDHCNNFVSQINELDTLKLRDGFYSFDIISLTNVLFNDRLERLGAFITGTAFTIENLHTILECFNVSINETPIKIDTTYYGIFALLGSRIKKYSLNCYQEAFQYSNEKWFGYVMEFLWKPLFVNFINIK